MRDSVFTSSMLFSRQAPENDVACVEPVATFFDQDGTGHAQFDSPSMLIGSPTLLRVTTLTRDFWNPLGSRWLGARNIHCPQPWQCGHFVEMHF